MIPMTLAEIARVVGGELTAPEHADVLVTGPAHLDSREQVPGGLFVAIAGEHVDGHAYTTQALAGGSVAVLGSRDTGVPGVLVPGGPAATTEALAALARHVVRTLRAQGELTVLAMTGSQGKTGTKDYLAAVLGSVAQTTATRANHNNELGVPLTVLLATPDTRYLVVEMGARGVGHIRHLTEIVAPDVAAVLNVGTAHLAEFGSREAIAVAKGEILENLPATGTAVLNADDPLVLAMAERTRAHVSTFGSQDSGAEVAHGPLSYDASGRQSFDLVHEGESRPVHLTTLGVHQVANASAAAAMALAAGLGLDQVASALSAARPDSPMRMDARTRSDGLLVVNDAYNANLDSMLAALETLALIQRPGRRVAVLGAMLELGAAHDSSHHEVGRRAAELGIDLVVGVGEAGALVVAGTTEVPGWAGHAEAQGTREAAATWVGDNISGDDVVLIKASRGVGLEHVVDALLLEGTRTR